MTTSEEITTRIMELRRRGLSWAQIGARVSMSRAAARERFLRATQLSERERRKHADALVARLEERLRLADDVARHARKHTSYDGALDQALQAYERGKQ